jgi:hypothetical protein
MLGYWPYAIHKKHCFCQKHGKHESQSVKKTIHIHSKIYKKKTQNTDIYKNKFSKAKFYSHKIQSVHLNPNPMKKNPYAPED